MFFKNIFFICIILESLATLYTVHAQFLFHGKLYVENE